MLARDLGYLSQQKATALLDETGEVAAMLNALRRKVELVERTETNREVRHRTSGP